MSEATSGDLIFLILAYRFAHAGYLLADHASRCEAMPVFKEIAQPLAPPEG
jgi:hypothetical protein